MIVAALAILVVATGAACFVYREQLMKAINGKPATVVKHPQAPANNVGEVQNEEKAAQLPREMSSEAVDLRDKAQAVQNAYEKLQAVERERERALKVQKTYEAAAAMTKGELNRAIIAAERIKRGEHVTASQAAAARSLHIESVDRKLEENQAREAAGSATQEAVEREGK